VLKFCGFDLELDVDGILLRTGDHLTVLSATNFHAEPWLIVEASSDDRETAWVCAPVSRRAIELVTAGRAIAGDAVKHSTTGWVEIVRIVEGRAVPDERVSCADLAPLPRSLAIVG
jgi:hypothetical protein